MLDPNFRKMTMEMEILVAGVNPNHSSLRKRAQSAGLLDTAFNVVSKWVKSKIEGKSSGELIAAGLDLIVPAFAFLFGHSTFGVILTVADALGFNFEAAYKAIADKLKPYLQGLGGKEPDQGTILGTITDVLSTSTHDISAGGAIDALKSFVGLANDSSINNMIIIRNVISNKETADMVIKNAGLLSFLKGGILKYFAKIMMYVILAVLSAIGLYSAGKATGLISSDTHITDPPSLEEQRKGSLHLNPSLPSEITREHNNSLDEIWTLPFTISQIESKLKEWARVTYSLSPEACDRSPKFARVVQLFQKINKSSTDNVAVPDLYHSIKDIVDDFAADVATKVSAGPTNK